VTRLSAKKKVLHAVELAAGTNFLEAAGTNLKTWLPSFRFGFHEQEPKLATEIHRKVKSGCAKQKVNLPYKQPLRLRYGKPGCRQRRRGHDSLSGSARIR